MNLIDSYIDELNGKKKEWIKSLVELMRTDYPDIRESFEFEMPTYTGPDFYLSFEAKRGSFYLYTDDIMSASLIKSILPDAKTEDDYIKISYIDDLVIEKLKVVCKEIIEYHRPDLEKAGN